MFRKENCKFRFATHLFSTELNTVYDESPTAETKFRISQFGAALRTTYTQEFCSRLDGLLKTLVLSEPQFIMCLAPNYSGKVQDFNKPLVTQQLKSMEITETLRIMSTGFSYRMRLSEFRARYSCLLMMCVDLVSSVTTLISTLDTMYQSVRLLTVCDRHVLMSGQGRQLLDKLRTGKRSRAARSIQVWWKGRVRMTESRHMIGVDMDMLKLTCEFLGKDWVGTERQLTTIIVCPMQVSPPPVPPSRPYTVAGNKKISFPHTRVVRRTYTSKSNISSYPSTTQAFYAIFD